MATPVFVTPPHLYVFYAVIGVWAVAEYVDRRRTRADPEDRDDRGSYRVLQAAVLAGLLASLGAVAFLEVATIPAERLAFWMGLACVVAGLTVRRVAIRTLDEGFSYRVAVRDDHEVVDEGLYRWVRHPSYTGGALAYVGLGLAMGNWLAVAAMALASLLGYGYRIRVEEAVLRDELGAAYEAYAERTPYRLIPGVW